MKRLLLNRCWSILHIFPRRYRLFRIHNLRTISEIRWNNSIQILTHISIYKRLLAILCNSKIIWPIFTEGFWLCSTFSFRWDLFCQNIIWILLGQIKFPFKAWVEFIRRVFSRDLLNEFKIGFNLHVLRHFMITFKTSPLTSFGKRSWNWWSHRDFVLWFGMLHGSSLRSNLLSYWL
jgi:hypothetical protein